MTETSVPAVERGPANAAQVAAALLDVGHLLAGYPTLEVAWVQVRHYVASRPVSTSVLLDADTPAKLAEIEAHVVDRVVDRYEGTGADRKAWWAGSVDGQPVSYRVPSPVLEPPADGMLVCGDCVYPAVFTAPPTLGGMAVLFEHARTHGRDTLAVARTAEATS